MIQKVNVCPSTFIGEGEEGDCRMGFDGATTNLTNCGASS
jgi:hypothetical protein